MLKKVTFFILLIVLTCTLFSTEVKKTKYWFEFNAGLSDIYLTDSGLSVMTGLSYLFKDSHFLSLHVTLASDGYSAPVAGDIQGGKVFKDAQFNFCPAIGVGYAYFDTGNKGSALILPISCYLQWIISRKFGIQVYYTYSFNKIQNYSGLYGGLIFGRFR